MQKIILMIALIASGCATPRSSGVIGINYAEQPPRVLMRWECNGKAFTTQGVGVCEQRSASAAKVSVKIPPLEGRVVYSNGQLKQSEDFNWYPKKGFIWKKTPIKDTWADLELGEIAATYGDWPVALDVIGVDPEVGVIVTKGVIYHRVCDDVSVPCSKLVVKYECAGETKQTGPGEIGKCKRMAGSPQAFRVNLDGATPGSKVYLSAPKLGINQSFTPDQGALDAHELRIEVPNVPTGPMLIGIRLAYIKDGAIQRAETRILMMGFSPDWTGLDQPHYIDQGGHIDFVKPVLADALEVNLYQGQELVSRDFTLDRVSSIRKPKGSEIACAFAWQRDSSDQVVICLNSSLEEVPIP